jgi:3'-phosphoadenosine 5'-phosphosulfate sulfotransferase (PAPS reductase)/FAD synthetase
MVDEVDFYLEDLKSKFKKIDFTKYYLAYSGGRDSHFMFWFIKTILKDDKIKIISVNTRLEHPQISTRMYDNADRVLIPKKTLKEIKEEVGIPCFTKQQDDFISRYQRGSRAISTLSFINGRKNTKFTLSKFARDLLLNGKLHKVSNKCCYYLKKKPFKIFEKETGLKPIVCVRSSEGIMREKYKSCLNKNGMFTPIFDLTDDILKQIELKYNIEVPEIYKYLKRTGCMGCPYGRNAEIELSLLNNVQRKKTIEYFKESYKVKNIQLGIKQLTNWI